MKGARIINRRPVILNPPEESLQEKSWREWQENFARVSADPESASITDLIRAIGYLDKVRSSIQRHAWEQGKKVDANVIAGYENEEQYYQRLIEQKQGRRRSNPSELHKWMRKLTPLQAEEVMRYADRIFYAALSEGFDSVRAREASDAAAERKAKELAKQ